MGGIAAYRLRAEARTAWRSWAISALSVGIVAGLALALFAGARRTETAHQRFLDRTAAFDMLFTNGGTTPENLNRVFDLADIVAAPEVRDVASVRYYYPAGIKPSGEALGTSDIMPLSSPDGRFGTELNRARLLTGRLPTEVDEIAISAVIQEDLGLSVGDVLQVTMQPGDPVAAEAGTAAPIDRFEVVGVVSMQGGLPPQGSGIPNIALLAPSFADAFPGGAEVFAVRLQRGMADVPAFERTLDELSGGEQIVAGTSDDLAAAIERGPNTQAAALRAIGFVVAAAAVLLVLLAVARQRAVDRPIQAQMAAVGAVRGDLRRMVVLRAAVIGLGAAAIAVIVAVAASPLVLVGTARLLEPTSVWVIPPLLVAGAAAIVLVFLGSAAVAGVVSRRADAAGAERPARLAGAVGRTLPAVAALGVRHASTAGRSSAARVSRITILTGAVVVGGLVLVAVFGASLGRLYDDPRLYGWSWDLQIGDAFAPDLTAEADALEGTSGIEAIGAATVGRVRVEGLGSIDALAITPRQGEVAPVVVEGRAPADATDVLLGTSTLRTLGLHIGDRLEVSIGERTSSVEIVGRGVLPDYSGLGGLGRGVVLTFDGYRNLDPQAEADTVLLRFTDDESGDARRAALLAEPFAEVYRPEQPADLADLQGLGRLPALLASVVGLIAVGTLAHALWTSVTDRGRDLTTYRALGLTRAQLSQVVGWQGLSLVLVSMAVGVPLGLVAGRAVWVRFADDLGVPPVAVLPVALLVLMVPVGVLLGGLVSIAPALRARRTPSGVAREER